MGADRVYIAARHGESLACKTIFALNAAWAVSRPLRAQFGIMKKSRVTYDCTSWSVPMAQVLREKLVHEARKGVGNDKADTCTA